MVFQIWNGVGAPKQLPPEVRQRLVDGFKKIAQDPEFQKSVENLGLTVDYLDSKQSTAKWIDQNDYMAKFLKETASPSNQGPEELNPARKQQLSHVSLLRRKMKGSVAMFKKDSFLIMIALLCAVLLLSGCAATTPAFPTKNMTMIVPYTAGGATDLIARTMEKPAHQQFGQSLVVTNMPGAGGTLAWNELAGSKPDGYTLGITTMAVILQPLYGETRYHYATALDPISQMVSYPAVLVIRSDQPWQNIKEFIQYAKAIPAKLNSPTPVLAHRTTYSAKSLPEKRESTLSRCRSAATLKPWPRCSAAIPRLPL